MLLSEIHTPYIIVRHYRIQEFPLHLRSSIPLHLSYSILGSEKHPAPTVLARTAAGLVVLRLFLGVYRPEAILKKVHGKCGIFFQDLGHGLTLELLIQRPQILIELCQ